MQVDLFVPCYVDQFHPETARNMVRILEAAGCKVHYNTDQTCCGMAAYNAGHWDQAKEVGEKFITEFHKDRPTVGIGGACTGMVRNDYSKLFHNSVVHNQCKQLQKNLLEFTELLTDKVDLNGLRFKSNARIAWMDSCQAVRECKIKEGPRKLLDRIEGLNWVELDEQEQCCGFGGIFSLRDEKNSVTFGKRKLELAEEAKVDYLVSTDTACLIHLDSIIKMNSYPVRVLHFIDLLAESML
ncbi:MAG: Fe-S oxidoreductase [Bacteroidetes bacterium]|nr:Fe-S oxidoreductase [Bacteroidota bacterium]